MVSWPSCLFLKDIKNCLNLSIRVKITLRLKCRNFRVEFSLVERVAHIFDIWPLLTTRGRALRFLLRNFRLLIQSGKIWSKFPKFFDVLESLVNAFCFDLYFYSNLKWAFWTFWKNEKLYIISIFENIITRAQHSWKNRELTLLVHYLY